MSRYLSSPFSSIYLIIMLLLPGCTKIAPEHSQNNIQPVIDSLQQLYAPDARTAIFNVTTTRHKHGLILKGETDKKEAKQALLNRLQDLQISFDDSLVVVPVKDLLPKAFGVVTISVGNVRAAPAHSSELSTQLLLGTPVKILKKTGIWFQIQGPDKYIGWIDSSTLALKDEKEMHIWQESEKVIFKGIYGFAYDSMSVKGGKVSDLVSGNILQMTEESDQWYKVQFPDQRIAYVDKNDSEKFENWLAKLPGDANSLVAFSRQLLGIPYLWGGTSVKGMDCSGFTKTVFFLNGQLLSRDASQQVLEGDLVDDSGDFSNLLPGDLLFFGTKDPQSGKERVVHVGMWIGNNEFIHASGKVMINSMDSLADHFDSFNFGRYLRTKRIYNKGNSDPNYLKIKSFW